MLVPKSDIMDAYNWAVKNLPDWFEKHRRLDRKDFSVSTLDAFMTKLMGGAYIEIWDYFDVYGYIIDGADYQLIMKDEATGEFSVVNQQTLPCECKNENEWLIEHHGRGSVVYVVMSA